VVDGSFIRGKITPDHFTAEEIPIVEKYLAEGGTLWLFRERQDIFSDPEGMRWIGDVAGPQRMRDNSVDFAVRMPDHPWVAHLKSPDAETAWLTKPGSMPMLNGEVIIGTSSKRAALGRIAVGKGQIIFCGFSPGASLPNGREKSTVSDERKFTEQMQIIDNIIATLYPAK
jgi:hypothetical protein